MRLHQQVFSIVVLLVMSPAVLAEPFPTQELRKVDGPTTTLINRVITLAHLAGIYYDAKQHNQAMQVLSEAQELVLAMSDSQVKDWLLAKTANKYSGINKHDIGIALTEKVKYTPSAVHTYGKIAHRLVKENQRTRGLELYDRAAQLAASEDKPFERGLSFAMLAAELHKIGETKRAKALLEDSWKIANGLNDSTDKISLLNEIANKMYEVAGKGRAINILKDNLRTIERSSDVDNSLFLLLDIADILSETDRHELALEVMLRVVNQAASSDSKYSTTSLFREHAWKLAPPSRDRVYLQVAHLCYKLDKTSLAEYFATQITNPIYQILVKIDAIKSANTIDHKNVTASLDKIQEAVHAVENPNDKAELMILIARVRMKLGEANEAVRIADMVSKLIPHVND
jgi:tetratricopeptide (TPR) repeat protein